MFTFGPPIFYISPSTMDGLAGCAPFPEATINVRNLAMLYPQYFQSSPTPIPYNDIEVSFVG